MSSSATTGRKVDDPDEELVRRIAKGDEKAAAKLVDRHVSAITGLARYMLADAIEAEDVAQEVFIKVWVHAKKWQPGKAKFQTWMHRVAINLCYDRLRKKKEIYLDVYPEREDDTIVSADELVTNRQTARQIELAINKLAPRQRVAIFLCHMRELGNIEAAAMMQISVEALESLLARGRRTLRVSLADQVKEMLER